MQAYYEIETEIPVNHLLKLQLPEMIPSGRAKIAIIYELTSAVSKNDSHRIQKQRTFWDVIQDLRNAPDFVPIENVDEIFEVRSKEIGREIEL